MSSLRTVSQIFFPAGIVLNHPLWFMNSGLVEEYMCACEYLKLNDSVESALV